CSFARSTDIDKRNARSEYSRAKLLYDEDAVSANRLESAQTEAVSARANLQAEERGVLRSHQRVVTGAGDGEVTSGTFSPTLSSSIGLARLPAAAGNRVEVDIRGRLLPARIVKPPFVRHGRAMPGILETIEESKS
ncbi:MAG: glycine cleavage T C-terminal barrel domain-containing protein, partial [Steroidobacteraceae bacterium]